MLERNFIECMHSAAQIRVLKYLESMTLISAHLNVVFNSKQFLVQNCNLASCSWLDEGLPGFIYLGFIFSRGSIYLVRIYWNLLAVSVFQPTHIVTPPPPRTHPHPH